MTTLIQKSMGSRISTPHHVIRPPRTATCCSLLGAARLWCSGPAVLVRTWFPNNGRAASWAVRHGRRHLQRRRHRRLRHRRLIFFCGLLLRRRPQLQLSSIWWTPTEAMINTTKTQAHCSSAVHGRHHPRSRHRQLLSCGLCLPQDHEFRSGRPAAAAATIKGCHGDSLRRHPEALQHKGSPWTSRCQVGVLVLSAPASPPPTTPSAVPTDAALAAQEAPATDTLVVLCIIMHEGAFVPLP